MCIYLLIFLTIMFRKVLLAWLFSLSKVTANIVKDLEPAEED